MRGLRGVYLFDVFVLASVYPVKENVADGVNQVSSELSHAALSLSGECGLRVGRGCVSSRSSLPHCTHFACGSTCQFVS